MSVLTRQDMADAILEDLEHGPLTIMQIAEDLVFDRTSLYLFQSAFDDLICERLEVIAYDVDGGTTRYALNDEL